MAVSIQIKDFKAVQKKLGELNKAPKMVIKRTLSDVKTRVPPWVAAEVSKGYGIPKKEVGDGKTSKLKVTGNTVEEIKLSYTGRVLTPTHFKMSPTAPSGGAYTLKASILKSQRATLGKVKKLTKKQRAILGANLRGQGTQSSDHSPIMLMHTGAKAADKTQYIPFQRKSTDRKDIRPIMTVSVPQMISGKRINKNITKAINDGLEKRLAQHMKLLKE